MLSAREGVTKGAEICHEQETKVSLTQALGTAAHPPALLFLCLSPSAHQKQPQPCKRTSITSTVAGYSFPFINL